MLILLGRLLRIFLFVICAGYWGMSTGGGSPLIAAEILQAQQTVPLLPTPENNPIPQPDETPLDLAILEQGTNPTCQLSNTCIPISNIHQQLVRILNRESTQPNLWFYREQVQPGLIVTWLIYDPSPRSAGRVDFVVNRRVWASMDYLQRYASVNSMGLATQRFGYNSRFFMLQQNTARRLATYTCNFQAANSDCHLVMEALGISQGR